MISHGYIVILISLSIFNLISMTSSFNSLFSAQMANILDNVSYADSGQVEHLALFCWFPNFEITFGYF